MLARWLVARGCCSLLCAGYQSALSSFLDRAGLLGFAFRSARLIHCALPFFALCCLLCCVVVLCSLPLTGALCLAGIESLALCCALDWCRRTQMPGLIAPSPRARLKPRPHVTNLASKRLRPGIIKHGQLLFAEQPDSEIARQTASIGNGIRDDCE